MLLAKNEGLRQGMPSPQPECLVLVGDQAMSHKSPATSAPILQMNSLAPAVKVREWVSGEPLAIFQPGKLYILEFVEPRVNLVRGRCAT